MDRNNENVNNYSKIHAGTIIIIFLSVNVKKKNIILTF